MLLSNLKFFVSPFVGLALSLLMLLAAFVFALRLPDKPQHLALIRDCKNSDSRGAIRPLAYLCLFMTILTINSGLRINKDLSSEGAVLKSELHPLDQSLFTISQYPDLTEPMRRMTPVSRSSLISLDIVRVDKPVLIAIFFCVIFGSSEYDFT